MTNYNKFKNSNFEQLVEWLDENCNNGSMPWDRWFQRKYCDNCEAVMKYVEIWDREVEHSFCEVNGYCRFFRDHEETLSPKEVLELWLWADEEE